jgi:hypothetical protein
MPAGPRCRLVRPCAECAVEPLIDLFRDAIQSGKDREALGHAKFPEAYM